MPLKISSVGCPVHVPYTDKHRVCQDAITRMCMTHAESGCSEVIAFAIFLRFIGASVMFLRFNGKSIRKLKVHNPLLYWFVVDGHQLADAGSGWGPPQLWLWHKGRCLDLRRFVHCSRALILSYRNDDRPEQSTWGVSDKKCGQHLLSQNEVQIWVFMVICGSKMMYEDGKCQVEICRSKRSKVLIWRVWKLGTLLDKLHPFSKSTNILVREVYWWHTAYWLGVWALGGVHFFICKKNLLVCGWCELTDCTFWLFKTNSVKLNIQMYLKSWKEILLTAVSEWNKSTVLGFLGLCSLFQVQDEVQKMKIDPKKQPSFVGKNMILESFFLVSLRTVKQLKKYKWRTYKNRANVED